MILGPQSTLRESAFIPFSIGGPNSSKRDVKNRQASCAGTEYFCL
jgi:hypothetical protein